jgi:phage tail sheath gpL-like
MSVPFATIPAALRTPLFYIEIDNSAAGSPATGANPTLIVGGRLATGTVAELVLTPVSSFSEARTLFGEGSIVADMVKSFRANNPFGELWCIGLDDETAPAATKAVKTITVAGTATADGVISLYVHGELIEIAVTSGDLEADIAAAIDAAITAESDLLYTNTVALAVFTLTARNGGETGSQIDVRTNYRGLAAGEVDVAGVTVTIAELTPGATNPDIGQISSVIGDKKFDYIIQPYVDASSLNDMQALMNEVTGRWSWNRKVYGHAFTAFRDTQGNLTTLGNGRNDHHHTIVGLDPTPSNPWAVAAAVVGRSATSLDNDPATPLQTLDLVGVLPPEEGAEFTQLQRNTLLYDGIATLYTGVGVYHIERLISTYQLDDFGVADDSFLDVVTLYTSMEVQRRLETLVTGKYARYKLADDGTPFGAGQNIVTPSIIRGDLIAEYSAMANVGLVENPELFAANLIVVRNAADPNRVDVLFPPDYINQLRVLAVLNQFRLQYPATA